MCELKYTWTGVVCQASPIGVGFSEKEPTAPRCAGSYSWGKGKVRPAVRMTRLGWWVNTSKRSGGRSEHRVLRNPPTYDAGGVALCQHDPRLIEENDDDLEHSRP